MKVPGLRSPHERVGDIVYFGRMLDKIRLKAEGLLPTDYKVGTRDWFDYDSRCTRFLGVRYAALKKCVLAGGSDLQILKWCFKTGQKPSKEDIEIWNTFMSKRGWRDSSTAELNQLKQRIGLQDRTDLVTWFDTFDADEVASRPLNRVNC